MGALVVVGCVRAPVQPVLPVEPPSLWVDAFASSGGDGGVEAALKTMPVLTEAARLHVRSGLYAGPFVFPAGTTLEGHGEAVLFLDGAGTVVTANEPLRLKHVSLQGGTVGLLATAFTTLEQVKFSGHRVAALQVHDAGIDAHALEVTSRLDSVGVDAINASVTLEDVKLDGPLSFGVRVADSTLTARQVRAEGQSTVIQGLRSAVTIDQLEAAGGRRNAVFLAQGTARLSKLNISGFEYAVLGTGTDVTLDGLSARGPHVTGFSFMNSKVTLRNVVVEHAGSLGGGQLLDCDSRVEGLVVTQAIASGLMVRKGVASIAELTVSGIRGETEPDGTIVTGDGLQVRDAEVSIGALSAEDLDGAGVYAANFAKVTAKRIDVKRSGTGAAVVERKSTLVAEVISSRGSRGPSIAAPEDGFIDVKRLTAQGGDVSVWADCASGSFVKVGAVDEGTLLPRLRCLEPPKTK